jgi:hypothetical protein
LRLHEWLIVGCVYQIRDGKRNRLENEKEPNNYHEKDHFGRSRPLTGSGDRWNDVCGAGCEYTKHIQHDDDKDQGKEASQAGEEHHFKHDDNAEQQVSRLLYRESGCKGKADRHARSAFLFQRW